MSSGLKPWKPGQSGNPSGRPQGLARRIREMTNDLEEEIDIMIRIARTSRYDKDRMTAIQWLADRAYGKAIETTVTAELGAEGKLALLEGLTITQLADIARNGLNSGSTSVVVEPAKVLQVPEVSLLSSDTAVTEVVPDTPKEPTAESSDETTGPGESKA